MRVDADDFARPCGDGKMHHEIKEILIEPGAVNALEEAMSEGFLKEYIYLVSCSSLTLIISSLKNKYKSVKSF